MLQVKELMAAAGHVARKLGRLTLKHRVPTLIVGAVLMLSMLMSVITVSVHQVLVVEDGEQTDSFYAVLTDEENLLSRAGIVLGDGDELNITRNKGAVTVAVDRAYPVSVEADGTTVIVMLAHGTVADALQKAGITANAERCRELVDGSVGVITAICPKVGYKESAAIAKKAIATGQSVREVLRASGIMTEEEIEKLLDPGTMV